MSVQIVNSTLTFGSGLSNRIFDLDGITYQRGENLGDKQILKLLGTRNMLRNFYLDDRNLGGVTGVASIGGTDNIIEDAILDRCQRYGFIFVTATRGIFRRITVKKAQHCISGSSGSVGDWNPSIDCIVENCEISGMIIDGIKLKNMLRTIMRNNYIDIFPKYPGYEGGTMTYSKSGIYFASTDTASKDCTVENNTIIQSAPHILKNRAILLNPDQTTNPNVFSSGNKILNNNLSNMYYGMIIKGNNYYIEQNKMTNINTEYINTGINNTIIPYKNIGYKKTLKSFGNII